MIVRYDTAHGIDDLHRHRLDPDTLQEVRDNIALDDLPTLTGFIEEAIALAALLDEG